MNQIICGIIKSTHPLLVKQELLQHVRPIYRQNPCLMTIPVTDRTCYFIINHVRELTLTTIDSDTLKFCRTCIECCHNPECVTSIAEHLINDSHTDLSVSFVQLLSDCLPSEIGRPFLERAVFERHELNNEALRFILHVLTKNRQLNDGQRTIFYIKLVELVLFRLRSLDYSLEQVELFCKQLSATIEELCYENNQRSSHLLNDMVNGVTSGLLTCLADSTATNEPSTALANIIDLLRECPNENLLDSFILTIDDDRLILCLNRLARVFRWPCLTTKPSQWLVSIWKLLFKRERETLVAQSASASIISDLISMMGNPSCYQNVVPALCWIFVNQPFHLRTFASALQNEILQLVINNPNFLHDNVEMNSLVESVRYGLKSLLNNEDNILDQDLLNNLLRSLPKQNSFYAKNVQLMKCKSSSSTENSSNETTIRLHDKVGLVNIGNTCYLNAIMQALYACTKFRQCVLHSDTISSNNELLKSLQTLFAFLTLSQRPYYRPEKFWLQTKPAYFERNQQQDCQEFLRHLLDTLHEEAKRTVQNEPNLDLVKEHLMGTCVHLSKCLTCLSITKSQDLFYDLSIGFNEQSSTTDEKQKCHDLQSLIDHAFAWEPLVNDNQFACDTCQAKQDGSRRMFLTSHPNYLILLLKRFVHNRLTGKYEKCLDRTTLPESIQLLTVNETYVTYRLKAIVVHHGLSMNSGHYYAFVMFNNEDLIDNSKSNHIGWWLFNDTHVEQLTFENVCAHFQRFQSATPYVLIFERDVEEKETNVTKLTILPYLQTLVDRDNQLYTQEQNRRSRSSKSTDMSDVREPYLRNTGCRDQSPDRGPPCIF